MNERLKELIKQHGINITIDGLGYGEGNVEGLAELIVRECAKFMDENSGYNDSDGCWFPEPEDMLKHFGVEE